MQHGFITCLRHQPGIRWERPAKRWTTAADGSQQEHSKSHLSIPWHKFDKLWGTIPLLVVVENVFLHWNGSVGMNIFRTFFFQSRLVVPRRISRTFLQRSCPHLFLSCLPLQEKNMMRREEILPIRISFKIHYERHRVAEVQTGELWPPTPRICISGGEQKSPIMLSNF